MNFNLTRCFYMFLLESNQPFFKKKNQKAKKNKL